MPNDLIAHADWLKRTDRLGKPRSPELKAVDEALLHYQQFGGGDAKWRLEQALDAWKQKEGQGDAWKKSERNKDLAVSQLDAMLKGGKGDSEKAWGRVPDFMGRQFDEARLGVLYLFGNIDADPSVFSILLEGGIGITGAALGYAGASDGLNNKAADLAGNVFSPVMVPSKAILESAGDSGIQGKSPDATALLAKAREWFGGFASRILDMLKEKFGSVDLYVGTIKSLVSACVKIFAGSVAGGVLGGALDTAKGLVNVIDASMVKIRTWIQGKKVELAHGHPATVVQSIRNTMTAALFDGLWQTIKGAANLGLTFGAAGAGLIFGLVTAIAEMLVKTIWRLVELFKFRQFCTEASEHWRNRGAGAFHTQPFAFNSWYRKHALLLPAISVLTLNSGICGDKMTYLSMYNTDKSAISSEEFLRGATFLDNLKPWGASFLKSAGYSFTSNSGQVSAMLAFAQSHTGNPSKKEKVWDWVKRFANA